MKLVFVSNYFNHQQKPICDRLYSHLGEDFVFLATKPMREERKKLGYGMKNLPDYVICAYDMEKDRNMCLELINSADAILVGSAPEHLIKDRIKQGKLTLRYSERPLKNGFSYIKYLPRFIKWHLNNPVNKPIYMLCASAYTASDYKKFFLFKNRFYKWGYFPDTCKKSPEEMINNKPENTILWCGRFIDWKHPDDALLLAKMLKDKGFSFKLKLIGRGEMETSLIELCHKLDLEDVVEFAGAMTPDEVRKNMENAQIYIATSDYKEGWGAVINEAMSSSCCVVASHAMGSVPYLIENGKNGIIYESGNIEDLTEKVSFLLNNREIGKRLAKNAYKTITEEWNGDIAGDRVVEFINSVIENKSLEFESGPMSKAGYLDNDWIKQ